MRRSFRGLTGPSSILFVLILLPGISSSPLRGADWKPISPQEMALQDDPMNAGASAIILYREEYVDDVRNFDREYHRIKILKEEGKKFADIQVLFRKKLMNVHDIEARTVQPDGKIIEFNGEIYEKPYLKTRRTDLAVKSFTLPGVQVGSILEYQYRIVRDAQYLFDSQWILQGDLSTRVSHFNLIPYADRAISWISFGLPRGKAVKLRDDRTVELHLENLAAVPEEEFSPPEELLKARVLFFYMPEELGMEDLRNPDKFWNPTGKKYFKSDNSFIGKRKEIHALAEELVQGEDSPENKLRKLYTRAQLVRNLSYERGRTEMEEKKEKLKPNLHTGDVLKNGYGDGSDISRFFAALAGAAGFDAGIVYLTARSEGQFEPQVLSKRQFDASIVHVKLGEQQWYLDPASRFTPFNLMPWAETASRGIRPEKDGYTAITTPNPRSSDALIERRAELRLDTEGALEGTAKIIFSGQEALTRRSENRDQDEVGYRKVIEDEVKGLLPGGATVELTNSPAWQTSDEKLVAEFKVKIPHYASSTGRRLLLPLGVFQAQEHYPFRAIRRIHPVFLEYPFQRIDVVSLELPPGIQVESLPEARKKEFPSLEFEISRTNEGNIVRLNRKIEVNSHTFPTTAYSSLRVFYDHVRAGDEEQVVLRTTEGASAQ